MMHIHMQNENLRGVRSSYVRECLKSTFCGNILSWLMVLCGFSNLFHITHGYYDPLLMLKYISAALQ